MARLVAIVVSTLVLMQAPGVRCFRNTYDVAHADLQVAAAVRRSEAEDEARVVRSSAEADASVVPGLESLMAVVVTKVVGAFSTAVTALVTAFTWLCSVILAWVASAHAWIMGTWHAFSSTWMGTGLQLLWTHVYKGTLMAGTVITSAEAMKWESVCGMWDRIDAVHVDLSKIPHGKLGFRDRAVEEMRAVRHESFEGMKRWIVDSDLDLPLQRRLLEELGPKEEFLSLANATVLEFLALGDCRGTGPADFSTRITAMGGALRDFCGTKRLSRVKSKLYWHWNPVHDLSFKGKHGSWRKRFDIRGLKDMAKYTALYKTLITLPWMLVEALQSQVATAIGTAYTSVLLSPVLAGLFAIPFQENEFDRMLCRVAFSAVHHPQSPRWQRAAYGRHASYFSGQDSGMQLVRDYCGSRKLWSGTAGRCSLETDTPKGVNVAQEREAWLAKRISEFKELGQRMKYTYGSFWAGTDLTKKDKGRMVDEHELVFDDDDLIQQHGDEEEVVEIF